MCEETTNVSTSISIKDWLPELSEQTDSVIQSKLKVLIHDMIHPEAKDRITSQEICNRVKIIAGNMLGKFIPLPMPCHHFNFMERCHLPLPIRFPHFKCMSFYHPLPMPISKP